MSPLKISLLLRAYAHAAPNQDMPVRQAYAPAMAEAVADFIRQGVFKDTITLDALFRGLPGKNVYLTEKGRALVDKLRAVEPDAPASIPLQLYKDGVPVGMVDMPTAVIDGARHLYTYLRGNPGTTINGMGDVLAMQRQLAAVTAERDTLQRQLALADALINKQRGLA